LLLDLFLSNNDGTMQLFVCSFVLPMFLPWEYWG
jgi:hypothetical protein